jgi:hypothetical protein
VFVDAGRGGPEGTAPEDSPLHYKQQSHAANIPTATIAKPTIHAGADQDSGAESVEGSVV